MKYGNRPTALGKLDIMFPEVMFYLYLPVKMEGSNEIRLPPNLKWMSPALELIDFDEDDYIYVTAKNTWFNLNGSYNRPGWHSDGFLTEDINYLWSDVVSPEFCIQPFRLTHDHDLSLREMEMQAEEKNVRLWPAKTFLKIDSSVIHRTPPVRQEGFRGFLKVSVSKNRYRLGRNSHNHLFEYDWEMTDRKLSRNDP